MLACSTLVLQQFQALMSQTVVGTRSSMNWMSKRYSVLHNIGKQMSYQYYFSIFAALRHRSFQIWKNRKYTMARASFVIELGERERIDNLFSSKTTARS